MKRIVLPPFLALLVLLGACQQAAWDEGPVPVDKPDLSLSSPIVPLDQEAPLSRTVINRYVWQQIKQSGQFFWHQVNDQVLWSAVVNADSLVSIGYQPEGYQDIENTIHEIDVKDPHWAVVRQALVDFIVVEEQVASAEEILAFGEKPLPYFNIKISRYETLAKLRRIKVVRYVEPMGYGIEPDQDLRSGSGCGGSADNNIPSSDYTTVSPGAKVSWNYYESNIPAAWGQSTGDNILVGLIDTGLDPNQSKLNGSYSSGWSTGRFREKTGTFVTGWWWWAKIDGPDDDCGHGTRMAGVIAAPRTSSGSIVGVAYKSDLLSIRGTDDVIINESREKDGVSDAYVIMGNRSALKIISMSLGDIFYSSQVADAVRYAHNKGKLIFCAAGTSLTWTSWYGVIFPATMSETVAVTGVRTGLPLQRCNTCHDGSQVDFVAVIQDRNNTSRTPLTLHTSGNVPSRTSGSSVATATTAGIAALVWAKNSSQSRTQVLQKLKDAASIYPSRDNNFGWGTIDALQAVSAVQ